MEGIGFVSGGVVGGVRGGEVGGVCGRRVVRGWNGGRRWILRGAVGGEGKEGEEEYEVFHLGDDIELPSEDVEEKRKPVERERSGRESSRKFESILDLPRLAAELEEEDIVKLRPSMSDAELMKRSGGKAPPRVAGYTPRPSTPNIDWRYWQDAGPRVDGKHCPGCGQEFQTENPTGVGYVPAAKLEAFLTDQQKAAEESGTDERDAGEENDTEEQEAGEENYAEEKESKPVDVPICARCFGLRYKRQVDEALTVSGTVVDDGSSAPALIPEESELILTKLRGIKCVVLYLVDIVDFSGTCLDLTRIVGTRNPVIVGANKCDLLPKGFNTPRIKKWIVEQTKRHGLDKCHDVHLLNSLKGHGLIKMIDQAYALAKKGGCDIYVVGAANVGKSSFINEILLSGWRFAKKPEDRKLLTTTSYVPGTTLAVVPIATGDGLTIYDTPGVVLRRNLTSYLNPSELGIVLPSQKLDTAGFRYEAGQSLLFGGLARIDFLDGKPSLANWFCSSKVKVHLRNTKGVEEFIRNKIGTEVLSPPKEDFETYTSRWEWEETEFEVVGTTWKESAADIAIAGLGWLTLTLNGSARLRVSVPKGVRVAQRPPLLPYEAVFGVARFTGQKWINKYKETFMTREKKMQHGKREQGRRAKDDPFPDYETDRKRHFKGFRQ